MSRSEQRRRIKAVLNLPGALLVDTEVLGARFHASIGNNRVAVTFPVPSQEAAGGFAPRLTAPPGPAAEHYDRIVERSDLGWGQRVVLNPRDGFTVWSVAAVAVSLHVERTSHPTNATEVRKFDDHFREWFAIAEEWIAAKHRETLRGGTKLHSGVFHALHEGRPYYSNARLDITMPRRGRGASLEEIKSAFDRASRGERLPLQHRLLLEADAFQLARDYRRAVIDAGTASEVALSTLIASRLQSAGIAPAAVETTIMQANGLIGLHKLASSFGAPVGSKNETHKLADVRNPAAHGGAEPSAEAAKRAIEHARNLVASATPLVFP